jgi:hypothetical protein
MIPQALRDQWTRDTVGYYWDGEKYAKAQPGEPREAIDPDTGDRYILAEPQRTNLIAQSSDLTDSTWSKNGFATESLVNSIIDGESATKLKADGSDVVNRWQTIGTFTGNDEVLYAIIESDPSLSTDVGLQVYNQPSDTFLAEVFWNFSDGDSSARNDLGVHDYDFQLLAESGPNGGRLAKIMVRYSGTDGDGRRLYVETKGYPSSGEIFYVHCVQLEEAPFPTSPIVTNGSSVTRSNDEVSGLTAPLASGAKSVYFRVEQEAGGYDPGEGGNITNAAINLTTAGNEGSAGNGLLRPSTGVMGVSADGIIDEVINTSDADIQGNSTTSDVDTFVIKPHKDTTAGGAIYRIYNLDVWEGERTQSEKESLRNNRPQPWLELDGETPSDLNSDPLWDDNDIDPPPYQWDIAKYDKIPAKIRSRWGRDTSGRVLGPNGKYVSKGSDVPRLSYDGEDPGLLVEAAGRTNELLNSSDISLWVQLNGPTLGSAVSSILKGEDAYKVSGSSGFSQFVRPSGTLTSDQEVVWAIIEEDTADKVAFGIEDTSQGSVENYVTFNFSTDTVGTDTVTGFGTIEDTHSRVLTTSGPNGGKVVLIILRYSGAPGGNSCRCIYRPDTSGSGDTSIFHHGQREEVANASSPIVTQGSPVTRAGDDYAIFKGGQPSWWNPNEMTVQIEFSPLVYKTAYTDLIKGENDRIEFEGTDPFDILFVDRNGPTLLTQLFNVINANSTNKVACSFNNSTVRLSANGSSKNSTYDGQLLSTNKLQIGNSNLIASINEISFYPRALPESTLNTLTS